MHQLSVNARFVAGGYSPASGGRSLASRAVGRSLLWRMLIAAAMAAGLLALWALVLLLLG